MIVAYFTVICYGRRLDPEITNDKLLVEVSKNVLVLSAIHKANFVWLFRGKVNYYMILNNSFWNVLIFRKSQILTYTHCLEQRSTSVLNTITQISQSQISNQYDTSYDAVINFLFQSCPKHEHFWKMYINQELNMYRK